MSKPIVTKTAIKAPVTPIKPADADVGHKLHSLMDVNANQIMAHVSTEISAMKLEIEALRDLIASQNAKLDALVAIESVHHETMVSHMTNIKTDAPAKKINRTKPAAAAAQTRPLNAKTLFVKRCKTEPEYRAIYLPADVQARFMLDSKIAAKASDLQRYQAMAGARYKELEKDATVIAQLKADWEATGQPIVEPASELVAESNTP